MSDDLADFLLARIAEDEERGRIARPVTYRPWVLYAAPRSMPGDLLITGRRVLAECAAKRAIVEDFRDLHEQYRSSHSEHLEGRRFQALIAVGQLALAYVDHPDWREEFRP